MSSLWAACEQPLRAVGAAWRTGSSAQWVKINSQSFWATWVSSFKYSQTDYFRHFCHILIAFKTRNTLAWWEVTCLEKKLCDIGRGCVTWREVRFRPQGCKRFSGQRRSRKNLQIHSWARKIQELVLVHPSGQSKPKTSLPYLTRSIGPPSQNSRVLSQHPKIVQMGPMIVNCGA